METTKIKETIEKEADKAYREIKAKCKTYGELRRTINTRLKEACWKGNTIGRILLEEVMKRYEEEVEKIKILPEKESVFK